MKLVDKAREVVAALVRFLFHLVSGGEEREFLMVQLAEEVVVMVEDLGVMALAEVDTRSSRTMIPCSSTCTFSGGTEVFSDEYFRSEGHKPPTKERVDALADELASTILESAELRQPALEQQRNLNTLKPICRMDPRPVGVPE